MAAQYMASESRSLESSANSAVNNKTIPFDSDIVQPGVVSFLDPVTEGEAQT